MNELCQKVRDDLLPAIGDAVPDPATLEHIVSCPECQGRVAEFARLLKVLREMGAETPPVTSGLVEEVLANVRKAAHEKALLSWFKGERFTYLITAAVGLASGALGVIVASLRLRKRFIVGDLWFS